MGPKVIKPNTPMSNIYFMFSSHDCCCQILSLCLYQTNLHNPSLILYHLLFFCASIVQAAWSSISLPGAEPAVSLLLPSETSAVFLASASFPFPFIKWIQKACAGRQIALLWLTFLWVEQREKFSCSQEAISTIMTNWHRTAYSSNGGHGPHPFCKSLWTTCRLASNSLFRENSAG